MYYTLYTLVDITHTNQHRHESGKETERSQEQNFNTVLQTLGLRSNIFYDRSPTTLEVSGTVVGFETTEIIRVWRFDWRTEAENIYTMDNDPLIALKLDFLLVPYIANLKETMTQDYAVFNPQNPGANIVFHLNR